MSKAELLRALWGETQINADGLRDYIREIRQALHDDSAAPRFVETVRGRGYRFLMPLHALPQTGGNRQYASASAVQGKREQRRAGAAPLLTIRGLYDGKTFRALPTEALPTVFREVAVVILFLEGGDEVRLG